MAKKYVRVTVEDSAVIEPIRNFLKVLDDNHIGIDEITLSLTNEDTGKSMKLNLIKSFTAFVKEESKKRKKNGKS